MPPAGRRGWKADGTPVNKRRIHETDMELSACETYSRTGDVTPLGALADYLDERGGRKKFAKLLRKVMEKRDPDVHFFFCQAGYGYKPWCETPMQARLQAAWSLARAEDYFKANEADQWSGFKANVGKFHFRWVRDDDYDPSEYDAPMPDIAFGCIFEEWVGDGHDGEPEFRWFHVGSLWGITFAEPHDDPFADPYHRVVQAELVLENCDIPSHWRPKT